MKRFLTVLLLLGLISYTSFAQNMINNFDDQSANFTTQLEAPTVISLADNNTDYAEGTGSLDFNAVIANVHAWGTFAMITGEGTFDWSASKDDSLHLWIKVRQAPADPATTVFRIQLWDKPNASDAEEAYIYENADAVDVADGWFELAIPFNERATDGNTPPDNTGFVRGPGNWGMGVQNDGVLNFDKIVKYDIVCVTTGAVTDSIKVSYDSFSHGPNVVVPVELTSFAAVSSNQDVVLNWETATEVNNQRFVVERKSADSDYQAVGSVQGNGTTTEISKYSFVDKNLKEGAYTYRLKQIDFDGKFEYSKAVEVNVELPLEYSLNQNYPNPFNPTTKIQYSIKKAGNVNLTVYNMLGQQVSTLVNQRQEAGKYTVNFDASNLTSGIYIYKISTNDFVSTKKMMLVK